MVGSRHCAHHPSPVGAVLTGDHDGSALEPGRQIPVPATAWYHNTAPTFAAYLALVCRHLWRARYAVTSGVEPEFVPFPLEAFEL